MRTTYAGEKQVAPETFLTVCGEQERSVLENTDVCHLSFPNVKAREVQKIRRKVLSCILNEVRAEEGQLYQAVNADAETVKIYYDPIVYLNPDEVHETLGIHHDMGGREIAIKPVVIAGKRFPESRFKTKHRLIVSKATIYGGASGQEYFEEPTRVTVLTDCAPDFMRPDSLDLKQLVSEGGDLKNQQEYKHIIKLLIRRELWALDQEEVAVAIRPLAGGGVFLSGLNSKNKEIAQNILHKALREVLEKERFEHLKEVIYALPNSKERLNPVYVTASEVFCEYNGKTTVTIANTDICAAARAAYLQEVQVGIVNAGDTRTVGGRCFATLFNEPRQCPAEEFLCGVSNVVYVQSRLNPILRQKGTYAGKLQPFPQMLSVGEFVIPEESKPRRLFGFRW